MRHGVAIGVVVVALCASEVASSAPSGRKSSGASLRALRVSEELRAVSRRYGYRDDLYGTLSRYETDLAPSARFQLEAYPAAFFGVRDWAHLGVAVSYDKTFGLDSQSSLTGQRYGTVAHAWTLGVRSSVPIGAHRLTLGLDHGEHVFRFDAAEGAGAPLPSVDYRFDELSVRGEFAGQGSARFEPTLSVLDVTSLGELGSQQWFPLASRGYGVHGALRLLVDTGFWHAWWFIGIDWRRYVIALHPAAGDAHVAGGPSDDFIGVGVGIVSTLSCSAGAPGQGGK